MSLYSYEVDDENKRIKVTLNNKTLTFQLMIKRAFTVLKRLLEAYPDFINIHDLDDILHDPNRAHSDLRNEDGFANFLIEKRGERRVINVKLDLEKLFEVFYDWDSSKPLCLSPIVRRGLPSHLKDHIYRKFKGRCNITKIRLYREITGNAFMKNLLLAEYDHRIPLNKYQIADKYKIDMNGIENYQLVSKLVNKEKNKICISCKINKCFECALAFPEKYDIIIPTKQNIKDLSFTIDVVK